MNQNHTRFASTL